MITSSLSRLLLCTSLLLITKFGMPSAVAADAISYQVVAERTHKPQLFTQGLLVEGDHFYETSGLYFKSLLVTYPVEESGSTWAKISAPFTRKQKIPDHYFAEGLALLADKLYVLTWMEKTLLVYDKNTLNYLTSMTYTGEGWGLTTDGNMLIRSDGSANLYFHKPEDFALAHTITVTDGGQQMSQLNELEYVDGVLWANVWHQDVILKIDPKNGKVLGQLDLSALKQTLSLANSEQVLNGIAWDSKRKGFWVTGKQWPKMFLIKLH